MRQVQETVIDLLRWLKDGVLGSNAVQLLIADLHPELTMGHDAERTGPVMH
ncbi:hypothetical protein D3C71_1262350 [compost metagenome]